MVKVETVQMVAGNGRQIRKVTRVTLETGRVVTFMERLSKRAAIQQALDVARRARPFDAALGQTVSVDVYRVSRP
jgi:hypothetical protein